MEYSSINHGVRKYDSQTGRFTGIDPPWEMYMGWSPYQYCGNNPVNACDGIRDAENFDKKGNTVHFGRIKDIKYDEQGNIVD